MKIENEFYFQKFYKFYKLKSIKIQMIPEKVFMNVFYKGLDYFIESFQYYAKANKSLQYYNDFLPFLKNRRLQSFYHEFYSESEAQKTQVKAVVDVIKANVQSLKTLKFEFNFNEPQVIQKILIKEVLRRCLLESKTSLEHIAISDTNGVLFNSNNVFEEFNKLAVKQKNVLNVTLYKLAKD